MTKVIFKINDKDGNMVTSKVIDVEKDLGVYRDNYKRDHDYDVAIGEHYEEWIIGFKSEWDFI